jgi:hypothetical protein
MKDEELQKKREEAERKARRGEIDPTHEFTFLLIGQVKQNKHVGINYRYLARKKPHACVN